MNEVFCGSDEAKVESNIARASLEIQSADAVLVVAGAGMSVESGLRNFGGDNPELLWQVYPALKRKQMQLKDCTHPRLFEEEPHIAWGFYGARYEAYRETPAHEGYQYLLEICHSRPAGHFVLTTNVDAHFEKAGFDSARVFELHGTLSQLCCTRACQSSGSSGVETWAAAAVPVMQDLGVQTTTLEACRHPCCPRCSSPARPLRVGLRRHRRRAAKEGTAAAVGLDPAAEARLDRYEQLWSNAYSSAQERRLAAFATRFLCPQSVHAVADALDTGNDHGGNAARRRLAIIEVGAGSAAGGLWEAVTAVCGGGEEVIARLVREGRVVVVRINPEQVPAGAVPAIHIRSGATPALRQLAARLRYPSTPPAAPPPPLAAAKVFDLEDEGGRTPSPPNGPPPPSAPTSASGSFSDETFPTFLAAAAAAAAAAVKVGGGGCAGFEAFLL